MASDSEEGEYEVERVLAERRGGKELKVKWRGYPVSEATWEPAASCAGCEELVSEFHKQQKVDKEHNKRKATKPAKAPAKPAKAAKAAKPTPAAAKVPAAQKKPAPANVKLVVSKAAAARPSAKAVGALPAVEWFVEVCTYCSGAGCYYGSDSHGRKSH
jgi:hypothetical protein